GAEIIPGSGPFPYVTSTNETILATGSAEEHSSSCASDRGVWFKFTPATNGVYIFSTDTDTATTVDITSIATFSGSRGTLTEVACNKGVTRRATITNTLTANVTRYILVWDAETNPIPSETSLQLRVSLAGPPT